MLVIRLQRIGKKKFPTYRLIVSEKARDTKGSYLEVVGTYNPHAKEGQFVPNTDRLNHWLKMGAQSSNTVNNLLVQQGIIKDAKKKKSVYISKVRADKMAEKKKAEKPEPEKAAA